MALKPEDFIGTAAREAKLNREKALQQASAQRREERQVESSASLVKSNFETLKKYGQLTGDSVLTGLTAEQIVGSTIAIHYRQGEGNINDFNLRMKELAAIFKKAATFEDTYNDGPDKHKTSTVTLDLSTHMLAFDLKTALVKELMEKPEYQRRKIIALAEDLRDLTPLQKVITLGEMADAMDANNILLKGPEGYRLQLGKIGSRDRPEKKDVPLLR